MTTLAYIFLPEIPFVSDAKSKEEIASALNAKYPEGKFDSAKIIISRKESKHHAYAQTTQEHQASLLKLNEITISGKTVPLKKCFPNHQIYINKLPDNCSKQQISKYFSNFGTIADIELFPAEGNWDNFKDKASVNHCYIRFQINQDAEKCLFSEEKHIIRNNDPIRVVRAYKIGQNDQTDKKLFLKIAPLVQKPQILKLQREIYNEFKKFGQLREKIKIEQLSNQASKALITFTSIDAGQNALKNFNSNLQVNPPRTFVLRSFASKQSYMVFIGGLRIDTTEEKIKLALQRYGKIVNCTINQSKKNGILNAVVTFSEEESFKLALTDYKTNQDFTPLFAGQPFMDIHLSATLRNDYNTFKKKDKKGNETVNLMSMGGIGMPFVMPQRMNQVPQQGFMGVNQVFGMNPIGMGLTPPPNMSSFYMMVPPPSSSPLNPNFGRSL